MPIGARYVITALVLAGCTQTTAPPARSPSGGIQPPPLTSSPTPALPSELLVGEGSGPALYLGVAPDAPAFGYVSPGVQLRIAGPLREGRVAVVIDGALRARGFIPVERLAARAQHRGRVQGTPVYLGPNDVVKVIGPYDQTRLRVAVEPRAVVDNEELILGAYEGVVPRAQLGAHTVDPGTVKGPTLGRVHLLPIGQSVNLYDKPDGQIVATLPPLATGRLRAVVLVDRGPWKGVRIGNGPYLIGFVRVPIEPVDPQEQSAALSVEHLRPRKEEAEAGAFPARLQIDGAHTLWRVKPGAKLRFDGNVVGMTTLVCYARELARYEREGVADVFVACDNDLALRGMVKTHQLVPVEPPTGLQ